MEIATKEDFMNFKTELIQILSGSKNNDPWIMSMKEVTEKTGYSETQIKHLIDAGKLNPWKDSESKNAKLRFYSKEVLEIIPDRLRKKYGNP